MKTILCFILILSTGISSAQSLAPYSAAQEQQEQQNDQFSNVFIGSMVAVTAVVTALVVVSTSKAQKRAEAEEAQFQACVGKTKSDIYTLYGPPNSIVDDAQGQGGTILEYSTLKTSGGGKRPVYSQTYRKLFYLNKDNSVTSVKEDIQ